jgi:hypothetical protein
MKYLKKFNEDVNLNSNDTENYMFFGNLKAIERMVDELLQLDEQAIDDIIKNGHDWAEDHVGVAKENIEQVYNFLINKEEIESDVMGEPETGAGFDKLPGENIINEE